MAGSNTFQVSAPSLTDPLIAGAARFPPLTPSAAPVMSESTQHPRPAPGGNTMQSLLDVVNDLIGGAKRQNKAARVSRRHQSGR